MRLSHLVAGEDAVIQPVAEAFLQAAEVGHGIVVVAMRDQQAAAVGGDVDGPAAHLHRRQREAAEAADRAIVVAGDVDQFGAGTTQRVQGFDHAVVRVSPGRASLRQPPQVDDVADQVQLVALQSGEEIRQLRRVAMAGTQVHVGDEHRAPTSAGGGGRAHAGCLPPVAGNAGASSAGCYAGRLRSGRRSNR